MSTMRHEAAASRARLLLIDDSRFIRKLFTFVFADLGYDVDTAADGAEGIRMAAARRYDAVIVDGLLPDMDGREVCRKIHALEGADPVLILYTASQRHFQDRFTAVHDGIDLCMKKDASNGLLVDKVAELLAARREPGLR